MFRKSWMVIVIGCALCLVASSAMAAGNANLLFGQKQVDMKLSVFAEEADDVVIKSLEDAETQTMWGVMTSWGGAEWPVWIAVDYINGSGDGTYRYEEDDFGVYEYKLTYDTMEFDIGARKFWGRDRKFAPYLGLGLAWAEGKAKLNESFTSSVSPAKGTPEDYDDQIFDVSKSKVGWFINGGIFWKLGKTFNLGIDLRYSDAKLKFTEEDFLEVMPSKQEDLVWEPNAGGFSYSILLGARWGS